MSIKKSLPIIVIGSFILAFGLFNFNEQNYITEGGSLGLGLLINHHFNISPSITLFILDILAFCLGIRYFGKNFLIKSIIATTCFSVFYGLFESVGYVIPSLEDYKMIAAIFSGLFVGIGVGLVVRTEAASNGDDSISLIVNHITKIGVGKVYLIMDLTIIGLSLTYLSIDQIGYSLIAVTISSYIIEKISTFRQEDEVFTLSEAA